jgi:uncharacterized small protein (DUF1192 family)
MGTITKYKGGNKMKKALLIIALVVAVVAIPILSVGCGGGLSDEDLKTIRGFAARIDSLEAKTSQINSKVENLNSNADTTELEEDIAAIQTELDNLKADLDSEDSTDLDARVTALEDELASSGNSTDTEVGLNTRWTLDVDLEAPPSGLSIEEYSWYPTRIKEADTYKISIDLTNDGTAKNNQVLIISLAPSNRDTNVDINNTGIYSVNPVSIWWDSSYSPSDGVGCRGMEFISDPFDIPAVTEYPIKVEFDLYYD